MTTGAGKQKAIAEEYTEFVDKAATIAENEGALYPLGKRETKRDRFEKHLIAMLEMYHIRYGDPDQRLQIASWLEGQLFRVPPIKGEVCHLTLDMWLDLKKAILAGEYRDASKPWD